MSLFARLLALHGGNKPLEDFFTEVIAYFFTVSPETLYAWLDQLKLVDTSRYTDLIVSTQQALEPLEPHVSGSRFDLLIELWDGNQRDWIVIESKIGSSEGPNQLRRYAELLAARSDIRRRSLIYITRDYEPKNPQTILENLSSTMIQFQQLRWYSFYNFLCKQPRNILSDEILRFMEEKGMAQSNLFTAADILALSNLQKVFSLMKASLDEEVKSRLGGILGADIKYSGTDQILFHRRYYLTGAPSNEWWCGVGFFLPAEGALEYPLLKLHLEVVINAKIDVRQKLISAMQEIAQRPGWESFNLGLTRAWSGVYRERSLRHMLAQSDHVFAIKACFFEFLDELAEIKRQYPDLPWGVKQ